MRPTMKAGIPGMVRAHEPAAVPGAGHLAPHGRQAQLQVGVAGQQRPPAPRPRRGEDPVVGRHRSRQRLAPAHGGGHQRRARRHPPHQLLVEAAEPGAEQLVQAGARHARADHLHEQRLHLALALRQCDPAGHARHEHAVGRRPRLGGAHAHRAQLQRHPPCEREVRPGAVGRDQLGAPQAPELLGLLGRAEVQAEAPERAVDLDELVPAREVLGHPALPGAAG